MRVRFGSAGELSRGVVLGGLPPKRKAPRSGIAPDPPLQPGAATTTVAGSGYALPVKERAHGTSA